MAPRGLKGWIKGIILCSFALPIYGFPNLTNNDPFPHYSSVYPYSYLATRQIANLMSFDYSYPENRFRISVSGYRQFATRGRNSEKDTVNLGDLNGRWNMLGLFYDAKLRKTLFDVLGITGSNVPSDDCERFIIDPKLVDPNKEFGFFSIPLQYRKYGARFESEILLIDRCFYAVGLKVQWGITDIRQSVLAFEDFTCQALGIACPAAPRGIDPTITSGPEPLPASPQAIAPPFVDPTTVPPCPQPACDPEGITECVVPLQPFKPSDTQTVNQSFDGECKQFVLDNIMSLNQRNEIFDTLGLDACNFHKVGVDDLKLSLFWRQIFIINEDDERYPRVLFMPFAEAGVGIPMSKEKSTKEMFALPIGNNHHTHVGGLAGFTVNFLATIDLTFAAGFSYFFKQDICNFRMPTNAAESGIFPYTADVTIRPGPTWHANIGLHAWHFLPNSSVWAEYSIISHTPDHITICRSFIPEGSDYFNTGFDVERAECFSKWEAHVGNVGFNFDLSDNFSIGLVWQGPIKQRNAYRSGTILGTINFVY